ncbi:hypothetical protein FHR23_002632 [Stakelama sediminis]|uniref:Class I SAM-dependent methyltransferase n=1 Tax=Stakelama sediminis TaxID=463200 RepID=A0A840Z1S1_9SPHN|nr:hypothetical protein [Stakelama sediminis]MBB5719684.1 hypothetical protein [Stakelama sediminis]
MQRIKGFDVPDTPHFDAESTAPFKALLDKANLYLEFGAGGSTVVAAGQNKETITVENDRFFARSVEKKIGKNSSVTLLTIDTGFSVQWGMPLVEKASASRRKRWARYVEEPFRVLGERVPDLVLIDGRFRLACGLRAADHAIRKGKPTTLWFDDYAERPYYHTIESLLGAPERKGRAGIFHVKPEPIEGLDALLRQAMTDFR